MVHTLCVRRRPVELPPEMHRSLTSSLWASIGMQLVQSSLLWLGFSLVVSSYMDLVDSPITRCSLLRCSSLTTSANRASAEPIGSSVPTINLTRAWASFTCLGELSVDRRDWFSIQACTFLSVTSSSDQILSKAPTSVGYIISFSRYAGLESYR